MQGRIVKSLSGFYDVEAENTVYTCKARGVFRKDGITPLCGDLVQFTPGDEGGEGTVDAILPRRNALLRPPVANLDYLFVIVSVCEPAPNALVIDRLTAIAVHKDITPCVVVTKADLGDAAPIVSVYRKAGLPTFCVGRDDAHDADGVRALLREHVSAFTGNTGVGKSTLLNVLDPELCLPTAHISRKLGRGRHTTRHVPLFPTCGGYVADTPGFSALDIEKGEFIRKDALAFCFPEFEQYIGACQFTSCAHVCERGCRVLQAVGDGDIPHSRHESYVALYNEAKEVKDWQIKADHGWK